MFELKNNVTTKDRRLDRVIKFDEKSRAYPIRTLVAGKTPRSYTWRCLKQLDQGADGACVGFGITHELISRPAEAAGLDDRYAKQNIYWEAQKIDEWAGGSYPGARPFYEGTSVIAGIKVAQRLGWFESYRWSFSLDDLILGVGYNGPAVLGLYWLEGMMDTDSKGFIHATGDELGGHCILCRGVNVKKQYFLLRNSWGSSWGLNGDCKISFSDMGKLLNMDGEAAFFISRHTKLG